MNVNGLQPEQNEKMTQLIEYAKQNEVNIALLVETNTKQTTSATNKMNN